MTASMARVDDLLIAVLHFVKPSDKTFPADREFLHRTFLGLKVSFPELLGRMEFRMKGMFPESLVLDQTLGNLEAARALHRKNADPSYYQMDDVIDKSYERFVGPRLRQAGVDDAQLQRLAAAFGEQTKSTQLGIDR